MNQEQKEAIHKKAFKGARKRKIRENRESLRKWEKDHAEAAQFKNAGFRLIYTPMGNKR